MGFRGIIFDLDGVIVSTDEQHYLGWQALADKIVLFICRYDYAVHISDLKRFRFIKIVYHTFKKRKVTLLQHRR